MHKYVDTSKTTNGKVSHSMFPIKLIRQLGETKYETWGGDKGDDRSSYCKAHYI